MQIHTQPLPLLIRNYTRLLLGLLGLSLLVALLVHQGVEEVAAAILSLGWGLLLITSLHVIPVLLNSLAWQVLIPQANRPGLGNITLLRWIGGSINTLLPVAQIGGDFIRARLLGRLMNNRTLAGATVLVDFSVTLLAQFVFSCIGLVLLFNHGTNIDIPSGILVTLLALALLLAGFYLVQRRGLFQVGTRFFRKLVVTRHWHSIYNGAVKLDTAVHSIYRRRRAVIISASIHLFAWLIGSIETWVICYLLGQPIGIMDAVIIESIAYAARSMGFAVPGALGVVEGAVMVTGTVLGIDPATGLALSIAKRFRELGAGIPGIAVWWWFETRRSV